MYTPNLKDAFPSYLTSILPSHYPAELITTLPLVLSLIVISFIGIAICFWYLKLRLMLQVSYTFLEIKPTDRTLKSPLSTNQLFTVLHSLERQSSFLDKLLGARKSISFELVSTKEEGIRYVLRIPSKNVSIVKKSLLAYLSGIEINEIDDYIAPLRNGRIQELKLTKPYVYPLEDQAVLNQYDPIAYITAHMTKLSENELVSLHFVCIPIHKGTHASVWGTVNNLKNLLLNNADITDEIQNSSSFFVMRMVGLLCKTIINIFLFILLSPATILTWIIGNDRAPLFPTWVFEKSKSKGLHEVGLQKQQLYQTIHAKISQPLFDVTIRFLAITNDKADSDKRLKGVLSSFDTFSSSQQSLTVKRYFFSLPQRLTYFQLKNRLSLFSHNPILSVSELSSLYHLPYTLTTKTEDLLHIKSPQLASPLSLKQSNLDLDITFAHNRYGETVTPIGLTLEERRRHAYIIGATGTGKSTLLLHMIYQDIVNGKSLAVIDPHGELVERLLGIIPTERRNDVVYVNPYDLVYPVGLNLLELPKGLSGVELQREKDFITSTLISVFHKLYDARYSGPRMEHILRNVILTALELENPTLFTIYELLTKVKYRKSIVNTLQDEVLKTFWKDEFEKFGSFQKAEQISPITNKLGRFLTTVMTRNILNQQESKLDFADVMDNGKILLCNLSKGMIGEDVSFFLGSLIIAKIQLTALRRIHIPQDKRKDSFLYIDEFQNFATTSFAQVLSEARKYRLSAVLAHQNTVQIEKDLLETIIGNSGTLISFRTTSPNDEDKLLPIFSPQVEKGQIANLPSYSFYIKINALKPQDAFTGEIDDFQIKGDTAVSDEIITFSQTTYGTKIVITGSKQTVVPPVKDKKPMRKKVNAIEMEKQVSP